MQGQTTHIASHAPKALILRDKGMAISIKGFSADTGDKADTDYRDEYNRHGFAERELLVACAVIQTKRFVHPSKHKEDTQNDKVKE